MLMHGHWSFSQFPKVDHSLRMLWSLIHRSMSPISFHVDTTFGVVHGIKDLALNFFNSVSAFRRPSNNFWIFSGTGSAVENSSVYMSDDERLVGFGFGTVLLISGNLRPSLSLLDVKQTIKFGHSPERVFDND